MQRDMELVREILLFLEARASTAHVDVCDFPIEGRTDTEIQYHLNLIWQAGFLNGEPTRSKTSDRMVMVPPFDLT